MYVENKTGFVYVNEYAFKVLYARILHRMGPLLWYVMQTKTKKYQPSSLIP